MYLCWRQASELLHSYSAIRSFVYAYSRRLANSLRITSRLVLESVLRLEGLAPFQVLSAVLSSSEKVDKSQGSVEQGDSEIA